jgi:hypothetical protein
MSDAAVKSPDPSSRDTRKHKKETDVRDTRFSWEYSRRIPIPISDKFILVVTSSKNDNNKMSQIRYNFQCGDLINFKMENHSCSWASVKPT